MKKFIGLAFCLSILSACSHEVGVTYTSVPSGAAIYEQGLGIVGTCPVTVKYNANDVKVSDGKIHTDEIKVVWVSGAMELIPPTAVDIPSNGIASVTFTRPKDFIGNEMDERHATELEQSLATPEEKYFVTPHQYKSVFDDFNNSVTCLFEGITENVNAECD